MFVAAGGNSDSHISHLALAPHHTLRELINLNAGFQHLVACVGRAVWNGNAIAKEGRRLLLASQHAINIAFSHIARLHKGSGNLANSLFFIPGLRGRVDILNR